MANQVKKTNVFAVLLSAIITIAVVLGIIFGPKLNSCLKTQIGLSACINKIVFKNEIGAILPVIKEKKVTKEQEEIIEPIKIIPAPLKTPIEIKKPVLPDVDVTPIKVEEQNLPDVKTPIVENEIETKTPLIAPIFQPEENEEIIRQKTIIENIVSKNNTTQETVTPEVSDQGIVEQKEENTQFYEPKNKTQNLNINPEVEMVRIEAGNALVIEGSGKEGDSVVVFANGRLLGDVDVKAGGVWIFISNLTEISGYRINDDVNFIKNDNGSYEILFEDVGVNPVNISVQRIEFEKGAKTPSSKLFNSSYSSIKPYLSIDAIRINQGGNSFSGRGESGLIAQLFVDGELVGRSRVKNGIWQIDVDENMLNSPNQQVRIDFLKTGSIGVFASANVDFFGASKKQTGAYFDYGYDGPRKDVAGNRIIVKKGDNLWNLAKKYYGAGYRYNIIYNANGDKINDPHWIYPKQIFELPY